MGQGRYQFTYHAEKEHQEISLEDKRAAVLHGDRDRLNQDAPPGRASYVCWYRHPRFGLLRAVYAVREPPPEGEVLVLTVFQD